jgi:hypothetical protein
MREGNTNEINKTGIWRKDEIKRQNIIWAYEKFGIERNGS